MSTFSSVVRKPGQKIQPKAPRRNVLRNNARRAVPPSLTPESQPVSPAVEPVDKVPQTQEPEPEPEPEPEIPRTVRETNEIPQIFSSIPAVIPTIETASENIDQPSPNSGAATAQTSSVLLEVDVPSSTSQGIQIIHPTTTSEHRARQDAIPTISISTPGPTREKRKATNEPTPAPSEGSAQETEDAEAGRKRQKTTHPTRGATDSESGTPLPSHSTPRTLRGSSRRSRSKSRTSDALLRDATTQAAAVSELANGIESRARSVRSRSERRSASQVTDAEQSTAEESSQAQNNDANRKTRAERIQELAQRVVQAAIGGDADEDESGPHRRSRHTTPENAEELEIDPEEVSMSELTKDIKIGPKSKTEKRMQENWVEIKRRRKEDAEKRRSAARAKDNSSGTQDERGAEEEVAVPKQIIVNGQIVVANESRQVAFGAGVEKAAKEKANVAIEDDRIYKQINYGTLSKKGGREKGKSWDEDQTNLFYKGLRMFGTDFTMIANLFPENVDRRAVKKKYQKELLSDSARVEKCVTAKESVSLEEYSEMTSMEFEDPDQLMKELDEEEKRLREEDEKRRQEQGFVMDNEGADVPLPSTERDETAEAEATTGGDEQVATADEDAGTPAATRRTQAPSTARSDRVDALAQKAVQAAVAPKKKQQRRTRESTGAGRGGWGGKKGTRAVGGVEERIGPLDEVEL